MAAALPIIMIAGTAYSVYQGMEAAQLQKQAAADAERIGRENAAIIEQEGQEEIRRTKDAQEQQAGSARAAINASSLGGETTGNYLNDLTDSHVEAISWLEKSSTNRQKIAINTGMYTAQTARAGASQTMAGVAGNISTGAGNLYTAGGNAIWWLSMAFQLPSTLQNTQVRSLGQASPSEPVQAANAEASAALAWGNAFNAAGAATNKILGDLADSRRDQKVSRSVLEDKMGYAQFEAELNKNVYTPGVDPELDNAADVWKKEQADWDESMPIPMAEIANAAWVAKTKSLTAARLEFMDEKEGAAYINNMTPTVYNGTQRLANSTIVRQLESVKAEQDAQYLRYASQGNEQDALQVLKEGFTTGVYTFKEYREKEMMLGSVIDTSNIRNMLDTAQDPADVEEAEDALANSRVLPEQKSALYKRVDAGKEEQYKFRTRRQDANYTEGQNMSVGGTLTRAYITDTDMTGGQKSALLSQLTSKQTVMSNKNVASDLAGQIREIKYIEDSPYASVSEKSEALREQLRVATYGLRDQSTGRYLIEPSISGEDYAKLDGDLNKAQTEWAHSNPYYKQSIEQLKKITGYSDMFSSISGNAPNFEAYRDGKLAMDSYMDTMGAEADPRDWLKDYGKMFDYKTYAKQGVGDYVGKSFPEYSEFKDKDGNFDRDLIIADAYFRREKGELEGWQVEQLVFQMDRLPELQKAPGNDDFYNQ